MTLLFVTTHLFKTHPEYFKKCLFIGSGHFLTARNICNFDIFYYFVTLLYNQEECKGIIKKSKGLIFTSP